MYKCCEHCKDEPNHGRGTDDHLGPCEICEVDGGLGIELVQEKFEEIFDVQYIWPDRWELHIRIDGRIEYDCEHGVGHGGVHGCDGCCRKDSYPPNHGARTELREEDRVLWNAYLRRLTEEVLRKQYPLLL